jgi:hypothetical protein
MTQIKQYRPAFMELGEKICAPFETVDDLMAIPFVSGFRNEPGFYRFSLFGREDGSMPGAAVSLMAEYDSGRRWLVIGTIEGTSPDLPLWEPVR